MTKPPSRKPSDVQRAFSIVEMMVAAAILSAVVALVAQVVGHAATVSRHNDDVEDISEARDRVRMTAKCIACAAASPPGQYETLEDVNGRPLGLFLTCHDPNAVDYQCTRIGRTVVRARCLDAGKPRVEFFALSRPEMATTTLQAPPARWQDLFQINGTSLATMPCVRSRPHSTVASTAGTGGGTSVDTGAGTGTDLTSMPSDYHDTYDALPDSSVEGSRYMPMP